MRDRIVRLGGRLRAAALVAFVTCGLGYGATEAPFAVSAIQQPMPGTCCRYNTECNSGSSCVTVPGQTCSAYNQPNYCKPAQGGAFIPGGGPGSGGGSN